MFDMIDIDILFDIEINQFDIMEKTISSISFLRDSEADLFLNQMT